MFEALLSAFNNPGSGFMYAISAILAFGVAVVVERTWLFWIRWRVDEAEVLQKIATGDLAQAQTAAGSHPAARLIAAGIEASPESAWDAMGAHAPLVEAETRGRVAWLATVGNIATMLGLLGTVYGLILAFAGLGDASAAERTARLSAGIATAMATTAWGLMVGIPALGLHTLFDGKATHILAFTEAVASRLAATRKG